MCERCSEAHSSAHLHRIERVSGGSKKEGRKEDVRHPFLRPFLLQEVPSLPERRRCMPEFKNSRQPRTERMKPGERTSEVNRSDETPEASMRAVLTTL